MFYSKSTGGFYSQEIHGLSTPEDAIEITNKVYVTLLAGQSTGKKIVADANGFPVLIAPELAAYAPAVISMAQAQLALLAKGYLDDVEAAIATMPREAQIRWEKSTTINRDDPLTAALAKLLGLDGAALDALFVAGAAL